MSCLKISSRFYMLLLWEMRGRIWYLQNGTNIRWIHSFGLCIYFFFPKWWNFTCSSKQQPHPQDFLNRQTVHSSSAIFSIEIKTWYEISKLTWMFSIPFHVFPFISINFIEKKKSSRHSSRGMLQFNSSDAKNPKSSLLALMVCLGLARNEEEAEMV